jgi:phage-related protein
MDKDFKIKSTAATPDLDWSQVRETILMLGLAIGQIEVAMRDSDESVSVLTDSFTSMFGSLQTIKEAVQHLPSDPASQEIRETIESNSAFVSNHVQQAIMAFQFYDRLVQRMDHVCRSIDGLAELIADTERLYYPAEWVAIQQLIRSKYTMESERVMFDAMLGGASIAEALALCRTSAPQDKPAGDDIELF